MSQGASTAIEVQLFAPHESRRLTLLHNLVKEAAKDIDPIALTNTGQTGMVGQRLAQVIAPVPQHAEPIRRMPHELPFGAYPLEKHDQLQFEEHDGVNGRRYSH